MSRIHDLKQPYLEIYSETGMYPLAFINLGSQLYQQNL